MSFVKLYTNNKFSDLTIVLNDGTDKITINVHKSILYSLNPYFEKMFDNFSENNKDLIEIYVTNVLAAKIVIESIYGIPIPQDIDWKLRIDIYKCCDFFCVTNDLSNLKINPKEYDQFLDKIDHLGYSDGIIRNIIDNLPKDYDISHFPVNLLKSMYSLCDSNSIIIEINKKIIVQNLNSGNVLMKYDLGSHHDILYDYVPDSNKIILIKNIGYYRLNNYISEIDITSGLIKCIDSKQLEHFPQGMKYLSHSKILLFNDNNVSIFDIKTGNIKEIFSENIYCFSYSTDLNYIAITNGSSVIVKDLHGLLIGEYFHSDENIQNIIHGDEAIQNIYIASKIHKVIIVTLRTVKIWNYLDNSIITIKDARNTHYNIKFTPDDKYFIVAMGNNIKIYDTKSLECVKNFIVNEKHKYNPSLDFLTDGELVVGLGKTIYIYDKEFNEIVNVINKKNKISSIKIIPGKHYDLAKYLIDLIKTK
ncbi:putative BTB/POZ domain-containing protein [Cotonvirus japonicus]|uniref:BTB/POZ domain-containing protein n=1 Tax=Cotonvirus japonicus TaxID=2811091 RepID=A0ABM7NQZ5_9VIRU|nr:putative BTB/POZ domain-containing protein [Cotonvirus japonicus]BCS82575.1 putative BTB/POZ domain-containing protein [Cotonvirus japonicus]